MSALIPRPTKTILASAIGRRACLGLLAGCALPAWGMTRVFSTVETTLGSLEFELYPSKAPITVANYLSYVRQGLLAKATVYRVVGPPNQAGHRAPISVVQWGLHIGDNQKPPLPPIPHEPTSKTGLHHLDGTLSMARLGVGSASADFFICVGDQPSLDEGGARNPDGAGFAAFGRLTTGHPTLDRLAALATVHEILEPPIAITDVSAAS